jgi:hypothetical protein
MTKNIIQQGLHSDYLSRLAFSKVCFPQLILLDKVVFELETRESLMQNTSAISSIASMDANTFPK